MTSYRITVGLDLDHAEAAAELAPLVAAIGQCLDRFGFPPETMTVERHLCDVTDCVGENTPTTRALWTTNVGCQRWPGGLCTDAPGHTGPCTIPAAAG
jgi:hypothetical protein